MIESLALVAANLIVLHTVDGYQVLVNPAHVTSLHSAKPGTEHKRYFIEGVRCLVNLADGKFVTTVETCEAIRQMVDSPK